MSLLIALPHQQLTAFAVELAAMSRALLELAEIREKRAAQNSRRRNLMKGLRERDHAIIVAMRRDQADGIEIGASIARQQAATGLAKDVLAGMMQRDQAGARQVAAIRRNRQIMKLRAAGKSNAEIGQAVGMHEKSVARVISAELKRARDIAR